MFFKRRRKKEEGKEPAQELEKQEPKTVEAPLQKAPVTEAPKPVTLDTRRMRRSVEQYLSGCCGPIRSLEVVTGLPSGASGEGVVVLTTFVRVSEPPIPSVGAFYVSTDGSTIKSFLIGP